MRVAEVDIFFRGLQASWKLKNKYFANFDLKKKVYFSNVKF
jgi:hypothetical protein